MNIMNNTRANVLELASKAGLEPVQIDGIPEGFSFKQPDITISNVFHKGKYVAFIPHAPTGETVSTYTVQELLVIYKLARKHYEKK